jgi:hypothetical protein
MWRNTMKLKVNKLDAILDKATAEIRTDTIEPAIISDAAARVWSNLSKEASALSVEEPAALHVESCKDFQSLIPAFLKNELTESRALLFEDHTHECIPCRKALKLARTGRMSVPVHATVKRSEGRYRLQPVIIRWGVAAVLVIGFGLLAIPLIQRYSPFGDSLDATVMAADGSVYRVLDSESMILPVGAKIGRGETVRTAKDAHMVVKLADGSLVEVKDRSEFSIDKNGTDTTIHLGRGNVIVQAAQQKAGRLFVAADDLLVSVKGTVFSVNRGTKGARVSVVEGEVHLDHAGNDRVVRAGEQATTSPSLERVPVKDEISWSQDAGRYIGLLSQVSSLNRDLKNVPVPGVRSSTRLLDLMPEKTVLYAALPNLSQTIAESHRIMEERIKQNAALREWWLKDHGGPERQAEISEVINKVRQFGDLLGDEIAVGAEMDDSGKPIGPVVMATLKDANGFRSLLDEQLKSLGNKEKGGPSVQIVDDQFKATSQSDGEIRGGTVYVWINGDLLVASPNLQQLEIVATGARTENENRFKLTPFYARIADLYQAGAGLLVAADLEKIVASQLKEGGKLAQNKQQAETLEQLGVTNIKYFIFEQKDVGKKTQTQAVLGFNEAGKGISTWLAAPGPMGSLDYISPDANVVAAFVVKEPVALVNDLLGVIETASPGLRQHLSRLQSEHGIDIRNDIAAPLGGEFAFAIDGPILPTPSWKMVFEVNDPVRMQQSFERVVEEVNKSAAQAGIKGLSWERADIDGHTFYTLKSLQFGVEVNFCYVNGYLIAAPTRALVDRAVRYHDSGQTLGNSKRFTAAMPEDGNANFSAVFYHDLASLISPLAERMSNAGKQMNAEEQHMLMSLASDAPPTLACAYAEGDRIVFAANTEGGPFGLSPASLLGMPNAFDIQQILQSGMRNEHK